MEKIYTFFFAIIYLPIFPFFHLNIFVMSKIFNITLKVPGIGNHNILYLGQLPALCPLDNIYRPDEVIINGISQDNINYAYYFNETENNVIIRYYSQEDVNTITCTYMLFL